MLIGFKLRQQIIVLYLISMKLRFLSSIGKWKSKPRHEKFCQILSSFYYSPRDSFLEDDIDASIANTDSSDYERCDVLLLGSMMSDSF